MRHLKPVQIYDRLWRTLINPRPDGRPPPIIRQTDSTAWAMPARRLPSMPDGRTFRFLNETHSLSDIGWDNPALDRLWRYNQHYFDDLNAQDAQDRAAWHTALLLDWIERNAPASGTGWEPYPTSLRIVNWIKWARAGNKLPAEAVHSLAVQVRWLAKRLEWHLLGNHLFANAKALVFAGSYFDGTEANQWLAKGLKILDHELSEQILKDGGQFELSPMYHALAVEDVLDLVNISGAFARAPHTEQAGWAEALKDRVPAMLHWLKTMCHPDGEISFFNDAAMGVAPCPQELHAYALRLGFVASNECVSGIEHLPESGYARLTSGDAVLLVDVARIGPDYLPGHAHADTLSFELSLYGQRLFVNSGTSIYGTGAERLRQRGTEAHNTVIVNGQNSTEVWGGFRVARRAAPKIIDFSDASGFLRIAASHDGYRRLAGRPVHKRAWRLAPGHLSVKDEIDGLSYPAEARFHLHPEIGLRQDNPWSGTFDVEGGRGISWSTGGIPVETENTFWHPEFGVSIPTICLVVPLAQGHASLELNWA